MNGKIAVVETSNVATEATQLRNRLNFNDCDYIFNGFQRNQNGDFVNIYTTKIINSSLWSETQPDNFGGNEACTHFGLNGTFMGSHHDTICSTKLCPVCKVEHLKVFHLKGSPQASKIDRHYVLVSSTEFLGFKHTSILWSNKDNRWKMKNLLNQETVAYLNNSKSLPIGLNSWYFLLDDESKVVDMKLHVKVQQPGHFCCNDGLCIKAEQRCDRIADCPTEEDEKDCHIIRHTTTTIQDTFQLNTKINVSITIKDIIDIDDRNSVITLLFGIKLEWFDPKLTFSHLKDDEKRNMIHSPLWIPKLKMLVLTDQKYQDPLESIFIVRKQSEAILPDDPNSLDQEEFYLGEENPLVIDELHQEAFVSSFNRIQLYPFDVQNCSINIYVYGADEEMTTLMVGSITDIGQKSIREYEIDGWFLEDASSPDTSGLIMKVTLSRNTQSIILVTYLPTILMNIINQATSYIRADNAYELIITVNITCMMVLSSVYLSVSNSLPSTATIKPVEVWLLFNLAYPFLVIITNILLQMQVK